MLPSVEQLKFKNVFACFLCLVVWSVFFCMYSWMVTCISRGDGMVSTIMSEHGTI